MINSNLVFIKKILKNQIVFLDLAYATGKKVKCFKMFLKMFKKSFLIRHGQSILLSKSRQVNQPRKQPTSLGGRKQKYK